MRMPLIASLLSLIVLPNLSVSAAPPVPDTVVWEEGIEYTNPDDQHLQLNLARPKTGSGPFPAVICIHGGGFRAGKRDGYDGLCIRLAERGYVAATISYRLAPKYQFPAAVHDTKAAVRWMRANAGKYNIDPERIGVTGGSAGGHLAQFLGVTANVPQFEGTGGNPEKSSSVACVVNVYGPSDFTKSYDKSVDAKEVLPLWFGGNLETRRALHIQGSPLYWVTPNAAPTLCIHGTEDQYVAHEQAVWLVDKLKAAAVGAELLTLEGAGHGFKGADAEKADNALFDYFDKKLKSKTLADSPAIAPPETVGMKALFNGNDLTGWDGDSRLWSIKDGVVHGETTVENAASGNTFLIWKEGHTKDFELRLSFRCNATNNSGIQYRSQHITEGKVSNKWVVRGYQHEIRNEVDFPTVSGFIYDEGGKRGRICLVGEKAYWDINGKHVIKSDLITESEFKKLFKLDDWNEVVIIAEGHHILHYMNNTLILDCRDDDPQNALTDGILALQLHAGKPMWVDYKNVRIREIK